MNKPALNKIYSRYLEMCIKYDVLAESRMDIEMTLFFAAEDIPELDLEVLATSSEFDFAHDICGLLKHMNRKTLKVEHCFLPRCARNYTPAAVA